MIRYPLEILPLTSGEGFTVVDQDGAQVFPKRAGTSATLIDCQAFIERDTDEAERELDEGLRNNPHVSARWLGEMGKEQRSN